LLWLRCAGEIEQCSLQTAKFGTDPDEFFNVYSEYRIDADQLREWQRDRSGCVVDATLASRLNWKIGDHVHLNGKLFNASLDLTIRGTFMGPKSTEAVYFNNVYLDEVYPVNKGMIGWFVVKVDSAQNTHTASASIDDEFQNRQRATKTGSEQAFQADYIAMLGNVKAFILWTCMAIIFATLLVSANTMAMTIRERTRETAVLRSLGFSKRFLFRLFMAEAITLSLIGGGLGALGGSALVSAIAHSPQGTLLFAGLKGSGLIIAISMVIAALLGIFSSFIPAYRILQVPIAGGLRHVG